MRIAILHPDLGLGGAERLIIDVAVALVQQGHHVDVYTSHFDKNRCFDEAKSGMFNVITGGAFIPRHLFNKGHIVSATLRSWWLATYVAIAKFGKYDVFVCDQVSAYVPLLRTLAPRARVCFYCHFPDKLLAPHGSLLRRLYRLPFDKFEEKCTGQADMVLTNSRFTSQVFRQAFPSLSSVRTQVLYPCVELPKEKLPWSKVGSRFVFLSINRFERKKELDLLLKALPYFARLDVPVDSVEVTIAGGWDARLAENVEYHKELQQLAKTAGWYELPGRVPAEEGEEKDEVEDEVIPLSSDTGLRLAVRFIRSFSDDEKRRLLQRAHVVVYTPSNEHFGIVPLEAMAAGRPVIAAKSGGPLETVVDGETGFLVEPSPKNFAEAMARLCRDEGRAERMGRVGAEHVKSFGRETFAEKLDLIVKDVSRVERQRSITSYLLSIPPLLLLLVPVLLVFCVSVVLHIV